MKTLKEGKYLFELYTTEKGSPAVKVYNTLARKEWKKLVLHYSFSTEEQRENWIKIKIEGIRSHNKEKNRRAAERKAFKTTLKKGEILVNSWGYEQTNVDYYQIIEVLSPKRVLIQPISRKLRTSEGLSSMAGYVKPVPNKFTGEPFKASVGIGEYVKLGDHGYQSASKWEGGEDYCSWYA